LFNTDSQGMYLNLLAIFVQSTIELVCNLQELQHLKFLIQ
jgi:hypothetical protein